jgi:glycosyltransferase involved in cell wall biosynthesis
VKTEVRRILFVAASPKYGGTEKHLLDLVSRMSGPGLQLSIVCIGEDVFSSRVALWEQSESIQIAVKPGLTSFRDWVRFFRTSSPEIVVLVKSWTWCFPWYTLLAATLAGVKKRYVIAHLPPSGSRPSGMGVLARWRYRVSYRRLALFCTSTICVSDFIRRFLVEECLFPAKSTLAIRNGVSLKSYHPNEPARAEARVRLGLDHDRVCLICVASLVTQKRVDVLLDAMAKVVERGRPCTCIIVGEGPLLPALLKQAEALGLNGHVIFEGFHSDVREYLWAGDIFVLTSDSEGLPLSVLEAMACGLPCVVTDVGGSAEAVLDGECGIVVTPGSPEEVADAIAAMLDQPEQRAAMAQAALDRVRRYFDIEKSMAQVSEKILS